jgi:hypothetical protein
MLSQKNVDFIQYVNYILPGCLHNVGCNGVIRTEIYIKISKVSKQL